jgi:hypothetical protein
MRKRNNLLAFGAAAVIHLGGTAVALNKQEVAAFVGAINVRITRRSALMADRNNVIRNALCSALVKHKVFSQKLIF